MLQTEIIAHRVISDMHVAHQAPSGEYKYKYECVVCRRNKFCESQWWSLLPSSRSR